MEALRVDARGIAVTGHGEIRVVAIAAEGVVVAVDDHCRLLPRRARSIPRAIEDHRGLVSDGFGARGVRLDDRLRALTDRERPRIGADSCRGCRALLMLELTVDRDREVSGRRFGRSGRVRHQRRHHPDAHRSRRDPDTSQRTTPHHSPKVDLTFARMLQWASAHRPPTEWRDAVPPVHCTFKQHQKGYQPSHTRVRGLANGCARYLARACAECQFPAACCVQTRALAGREVPPARRMGYGVRATEASAV